MMRGEPPDYGVTGRFPGFGCGDLAQLAQRPADAIRRLRRDGSAGGPQDV